MKNIVLGDGVSIGKSAWIQTKKISQNKYEGKISFGNNTVVGAHLVISSRKEVSIGKNCLLSYHVSIVDHDHEYRDKAKTFNVSGMTKGETVVIEDECFIGAHCFILKGVHLGKRCVVGASSVVTKSFPADSLIAGNPAKKIKNV